VLALQVPGADRNSQLGPFKKKCLILAVLETDGRTHATAALGRIVIDLSEFASIDGQELRTFAVACNKSIHAAVGEPHLTVTIRCACRPAGCPATVHHECNSWQQMNACVLHVIANLSKQPGATTACN
jgi:hypothetical protein